jgi:hypothetical protein
MIYLTVGTGKSAAFNNTQSAKSLDSGAFQENGKCTRKIKIALKCRK